MPPKHNPAEISSYAGSAISVFAGLTLTEWGVLFGIVTALATFGLNAWYTYRKDKRDQQALAAKMAAYGMYGDGQ